MPIRSGFPHRRRRFSVWLVLSAVLICFGLWNSSSPAADAPQDDEAADVEAAAEPEPEPETETAAPQKSYLRWMYEANGMTYTIVFLGLSFTAVAMFVMNLLSARRASICPPELAQEFEQHLKQRQYQEAYELAKQDESVLGNVLSVGMAHIGDGYGDAVEAMQETLEEEQLTLDQRLSYLALIGTISPMVGLFGTVNGMISSFSVIAQGGAAPKPSDLAEGISTALFTTLEGLFIAIPAIAAFNILKNRVTKLMLHTGGSADDLMRYFKNVQAKTTP